MPGKKVIHVSKKGTWYFFFNWTSYTPNNSFHHAFVLVQQLNIRHPGEQSDYLTTFLWLINQLNGSHDHIATRPKTSQLIGGIERRGLSGEGANMADILDMNENINRHLPFLSQHSCTQSTMRCVWQCTWYLLHSDSFMIEHIYTYFNSYVSHLS